VVAAAASGRFAKGDGAKNQKTRPAESASRASNGRDFGCGNLATRFGSKWSGRV
jgi:hypothetical protein